jgi:iron complex transport system substrate-binding protein
VEGVMTSIQDIADAIGVSQQGRAVMAGMRERLDALRVRLAGVAPKRVLFVIWTQPLISIGPQTFLADALRQAGAQSIVQSEQDWPEISFEEVVRLQPEALIFSAGHAETGHVETGDDEIAELRQRPAWKELAAVREGRVIMVGEEIDRPGPRLVDVIEDLARQLHPESFSPATAARMPATGRRITGNDSASDVTNGRDPGGNRSDAAGPVGHARGEFAGARFE